jgi:hypothetical protein
MAVSTIRTEAASPVKHSQSVFFLVAVGWAISVAGLAYMWQMLA